MVPVFGWLHLMMVYASTLHKQYLGTLKGHGLSQAFDITNRKGLGVTSIKGPFHHDLNEALYHVAEAHIHEDWLILGKVDNLKELWKKTPEQLVALANTLVKTRASSKAIDELAVLPEEQQDQIFLCTVMWNRDVLQYIVLDQAVKHGDIGLMEEFLPHLLFQFLGGNNSKYANEILELLQALHREWPKEVRCSFFIMAYTQSSLIFSNMQKLCAGALLADE